MIEWTTIFEGNGLRLDYAEGIARIVLNRAPVNELGPELLGGLEQALDVIAPAPRFYPGIAREQARVVRAGVRVARNALRGQATDAAAIGRGEGWRRLLPKLPQPIAPAPRPRALIIMSENPKGFSAGADLRRLYHEAIKIDAGTRRDLVAVFLDRIHRVNNRIDTLPIPTIAVVSGVCFGGGFELALTCDLRIAERGARFAFPELRLGLIPGFGGIPRLKRDLPNGLVRDILLTGRSINAKRALSSGLAQQMVGRGEGERVAVETARQMLKFDPHTAAVAKRFAKPIPIAELEEEKALFLDLMDRPVVIEALRKFVNSTETMPYLA